MNSLHSTELKDKQYRHGLVSAQIEVDLPLQIRALRKTLVGTQPELSKITGMKQSRISAMEKPGGAHFTLETLRRLAEAFDVALIVRFAPFSELLSWSDRFDPDAFRVSSFGEEYHASALASEISSVASTVNEIPGRVIGIDDYFGGPRRNQQESQAERTPVATYRTALSRVIPSGNNNASAIAQGMGMGRENGNCANVGIPA